MLEWKRGHAAIAAQGAEKSFPAAALCFTRGARNLRKPAGTPSRGARALGAPLNAKPHSRAPSAQSAGLEGASTASTWYLVFLTSKTENGIFPVRVPKGGDRSMFLRCSRVAGVPASTSQQSNPGGPRTRGAALFAATAPSTVGPARLCGIWRPGLWALGRTVFILSLHSVVLPPLPGAGAGGWRGVSAAARSPAGNTEEDPRVSVGPRTWRQSCAGGPGRPRRGQERLGPRSNDSPDPGGWVGAPAGSSGSGFLSAPAATWGSELPLLLFL